MMRRSSFFSWVFLGLLSVTWPLGSALADIADELAVRAAPDKVVLTWTSRSPVDVYVAKTARADLAGAKLVSDNNSKGRFEVTVDPTARPYFILKDTRDRKTAKVAERVLPLQQGSNFRDLGGYPAANGKHVRWGMVFRSAASPKLTDSDLAQIAQLKLTDMVDLRTSEERSSDPSKVQSVRHSAVDYPMEQVRSAAGAGMGNFYNVLPTMIAPNLRQLFEILRKDNTTVEYNCSAGQDRAGLATALLLSALGVPRDVILADYHLSTTYRRPEFERLAATPTSRASPLLDANGRALLESAFQEIDRKWGSVEAYLNQEIGVDAAGIAALRAKYLE